MNSGTKVFITVTTLGGCTGIPLYLWKSHNTVGASTYSPSPSSTILSTPTNAGSTLSLDSTRNSGRESTQVKTSEAKGSCKVIPFAENLERFLKVQTKIKEDYLSINCKNTNRKNDYIFLP
ncbi:hypothetical protein OVS_02070 [Mycoplasma ovis str. Michigan]|uniref:Lipoprotein n=1 Tax=Mycoplasma ovis str. Michigan TaxID=1415773 RepID=A0ABM5P1S1_9MOLU|nr:hypothetical protein [Mycoplasma ovis]AHC40276.1 hypothetical protein OVS_02070 [Mycoplasma ovis str. Michigan]